MRLIFACCFLIAPTLQAAEWRSIDESSLYFEATIDGIATPGEFRSFVVVLEFDSDDPEAGSLCVSVDLSAADMGDPDMNGVLFDVEWFNVEKFTTSFFRGDNITALDQGSYAVTGELDLKGIKQPVTVPFTWTSTGRSARMRGELVLRRTDFGVGGGEWAEDDSIGLDVRLVFDVYLVAGEQ